MISVICQKLKGTSSNREQRAIQQLQNWGQDVKRITSDELSSQILIKVLQQTQKGFDDIVVSNPQSLEVRKLRSRCYEMSFNQALIFLMEHTELIRTPIVIEREKLLVGYNAENMRTFIPKNIKSLTTPIIK